VSNAGNLRPFVKGDARAVEAGRRSGAARADKRAAERADIAQVAAELHRLMAAFGREDLGPTAAAAALDAIGRVQRGEWKVRDPADWVRVLVDVARLEASEATSASIVAHLGADQVRALRDQARAALGSSSESAADDAAPIADAGGVST